MLKESRSLWRYAAEQWSTLTTVVVLSVGAALVSVVQPWPLKLLVDNAIGDSSPPTWLQTALQTFSLRSDGRTLILTAAIASLGVFAISTAFEIGISWSWTLAGQRMVYSLAGHLFAHLQRLSLLFHTRRKVGDSLERLAVDTAAIY